jgi:carbonic anhydrase
MSHDSQTTLRLLREGNLRFVEGRTSGHFTAEKRTQALVGQDPLAVVVGCSDSRVPVEAVFDAGPGELFVVRTAGHVLAQASLASIRFAVERLDVRTVVVLGHEDCGAVSAALAGDAPEWLDPIMRHIRIDGIDPSGAPADADAGSALLAAAVDEHVRDTVAELREFLDEIEPDGTLAHVVGAAYKLTSGEVHWLD